MSEAKKALNCEKNTPEMQGRVTAAASVYFGVTNPQVNAVYEHGQWFVIVTDSTGEYFDDPVTYSVNDAVGHGSVDGFCFEEL